MTCSRCRRARSTASRHAGHQPVLTVNAGALPVRAHPQCRLTVSDENIFAIRTVHTVLVGTFSRAVNGVKHLDIIARDLGDLLWDYPSDLTGGGVPAGRMQIGNGWIGFDLNGVIDSHRTKDAINFSKQDQAINR